MNDVGRKSMMLWTAGKSLLKIYGSLWMTAVGGILGANLAATIGALFFVTEHKSVNVQPWADYGWYGGTALFFLGALLGKLRFLNGTALGGSSRQPTDSAATTEATEATEATPKRPARPAEQSGVPGFIFACGLAGGFLGLLLGGSLIVFSISYAYSPFASKKAVASVDVVQDPTRATATPRRIIQSNHPVALYLCLTPVVLGAIAGAAGGGVIALKYGTSSPSDRMAPQ